jgi:HlyD family secretion protein
VKGPGEGGRGGKKGNGRAGAGNASAVSRGSSNGSVPEETTAKTAATYVWLVEGKKLVQKQIKTGLNDNTHVQVLEGLTPQDRVATGSEMATKESQAAASSPFMPQRPKRR